MTVDHYDLLRWLQHNAEDLRARPDMVTEAPGPTVRFRWHGVAIIGGMRYGVGLDLHPGPTLGDVWIYGPSARGVRLEPFGSPSIAASLRDTLQQIAMDHIRGEHDWGRGACLLAHAPTTRACA
ncbi:MAG: hypothetical protein AB1Z98_33525 [Nannocystaceae bacterium]